MKKIICLYGGPSSGKSTTCAGLFYYLKRAGWNCEMSLEYVKEWVWENRTIKNGDQSYIFAKQSRKERIYMENGLDFIITDSPLILSHFYGMKYDKQEQEHKTALMMLQHHYALCKDMGYSIEHYVLNRMYPYNPKGRYQTDEEASQYDIEIVECLNKLGINYKFVDGDENSVRTIMQHLGVK